MGKRGYRKVIGKDRDMSLTPEEMQLFLDRQNDAEKPESSKTTEKNGEAATPERTR